MSDFTSGWDDVHPITATYYERPLDHFVTVAKERCAEWSYADDPHGYCHERPTLVALVKALEARRGA